LIGFNFAIYKSVYDKTKGFDPSHNANEDCLLTKEVHKVGEIAFSYNIPVYVSARRYSNGFVRAGLIYMILFLMQLIFRRHTSVLPDLR
jgi:hypothetical protein